MREWLAASAMVIGACFMLLAAIGVVRLPDVFTRMQATTKAATLGIGGIFIGVAFFFEALGTTTRALLGIILVFLTVPVSAHVIARATYLTGVPLWKGTRVDELRPRYAQDESSRPPEEPPDDQPPRMH